MYIYESHMGGLYTSDEPLDYEDLYCEECGDSDWLIGYAETRQDAWNLLKDDTDIDKYLARNRRDMKVYLTDNEDVIEDWDFIISQEFTLLRLKDFIKNEYTFWSIEARYEEEDIIVYQVSDRDINIWLQDDYRFVNSFLDKMELEGYCDVYQILNDRYFGYEFTDIFDEIKYDEKMKNSN